MASTDYVVICDQFGYTDEDGIAHYAPRGSTVSLSDAEARRLGRAGDPSGLPAFPLMIPVGHPAPDEPLVRDGVPASMKVVVAWERLRTAFAERPPTG